MRTHAANESVAVVASSTKCRAAFIGTVDALMQTIETRWLFGKSVSKKGIERVGKSRHGHFGARKMP